VNDYTDTGKSSVGEFLYSSLQIHPPVIALLKGTDTLREYCARLTEFSSLPIVVAFSLCESSREDHALLHQLPTYSMIPFNSFSIAAIIKLLKAHVKPENNWRIPAIAASCNGDARNALMELDAVGALSHVVRDPVKPSKRKRDEAVATATPSNDTGKDCQYSFFHILGKILYNKEGTLESAAALSQQPVIMDAGTGPLFWLQENIPDFVADVGTLSRCMSAIIFADTWGHKIDNQYVFQALTYANLRGIGERMDNRLVKGFAALRKPVIYDHDRTRSERSLLLSKTSCRWDSVSLVDKIMRQSHGVIPANWSIAAKRNVYRFFHINEDCPAGDTIIPLELDDDPIEDDYYGKRNLVLLYMHHTHF